jgi:primosomal protein DnaI
MESLAGMLKQMEGNPLLKQAEEKVRKLLEDPVVVKWRGKHPDLDEHTLKIHLNRIHQYAVEYKHCSRCPGLERCPNDLTGHYTMLTVGQVNGQTHIYDHKVACKKWTARQAQNAIRSRIRSFYVDDRALREGYSLDEILTRDLSRAKAVGRLMDYILKTREEGLQRVGLYLVGPFGTGKTFLMCYMLHELAKAGYTGAIVYMPDFVEDLKSMFEQPQKLKETVELLKETDLLVFDDIGAENLSPWLRDHVLGTILNYRMNRKPTFFTSNYELDALEKHFSFTAKDGDEEYKGQRLMDRIRPFVLPLVIQGENQRGRLLQE